MKNFASLLLLPLLVVCTVLVDLAAAAEFTDRSAFADVPGNESACNACVDGTCKNLTERQTHVFLPSCIEAKCGRANDLTNKVVVTYAETKVTVQPPNKSCKVLYPNVTTTEDCKVLAEIFCPDEQ